MRETREALRIWFCLDTLEYLRRGGRIGKAQAWLGGTLKIKPILSLEYEIVPVERVRTAGRAFERMVDYAQELHDSGADGWVVQHIQAPEQAQRLIERCREIFDSEPVFTSEVGPVIGTYTGPGLIGVGASRARCWPEGSAAGACCGGASSAGGGAGARRSSGRRPPRRPSISLRWRSTCARQSVRRVTSPRSCSTETRQLRAVGLDRAADLGRRSAGPSAASPAASVRCGRAPRSRAPVAAQQPRAGALTVSRILRASSIAMFGTGGEPRLTALAAISPASTPSTHEDHRHREEAPEVGELVADRQVVVEQPGAADQREHRAP